jgi:hypothetical protein
LVKKRIFCRVAHGLFSNEKLTRNNPENIFSGFFSKQEKIRKLFEIARMKCVVALGLFSTFLERHLPQCNT